jgi:recombinational DNA repair protein (RecF pathway)
MEHNYSSCADCKEFSDPKQCKKFNNFISKIFGFVFQSDRAACISQIKKLGLQGHADNMTQQKRHSIRRGTAQ